MDGLSALVAFAKATVLAVGLLIAHLAYRAFKRTRSQALALLTVAMALITLGEVMEPGMGQLAEVPRRVQVFVNTALTTVGFLLLGYSLYVTDNPAEAV